MTDTTTTEASIACSLTAAELEDRVANLRALGTRLEAVDASGARATLAFGGGRDAVESFVELERRCCPFFEFEVRTEGALVRLDIAAPDEAEPIVRSVVAAIVSGWEEPLG
jgi:hypothetical protein